MLDNGCFITAQHVVQVPGPETMIERDDDGRAIEVLVPDSIETWINALFYSGQMTVMMWANSPSKGFKLEYSYEDIKSHVGECDHISTGSIQDDAGCTYLVKRYDDYGDGDWACFKFDGKGALPYDSDYSRNLPVQTKLTIVGFPAGQGDSTNGTINPIVSEAITSRQGLEDDGTIKTSNDNSDHGNSGGPVYAYKDGKYVVVGILVGANLGQDSMKGRVVPISAVFK